MLQDVIPKGTVPLQGAVVVYVEPPKVEKPNCIEVSTPSRSLFICAEIAEDIQVALDHCLLVHS